MKDNWVVELFYKTATGPERKRKILTPVGPVVFVGIISILFYASIKTDNILGNPSIFSEATSKILSVPFIIFGLSLVGWCVSHFRKAKGTPVPFNPPEIVVDIGPYAWSRNPMLTGLFIVIFGIGLWIMSISLMLVYLPLFIIMNYVELKKVEEPELKKRFGDAYIQYMRKTPMFIPWRGKSKNKP